MGSFETEWLAGQANLAALADLPGDWIDRVHVRRPQTTIVLDISVGETHGRQEGSPYNGRFGCACYHPLFVLNQFADLGLCALRSGNVRQSARSNSLHHPSRLIAAGWLGWGRLGR